MKISVKNQQKKMIEQVYHILLVCCLQPLQTLVWVCLLCSVPVVSVVLMLISKYSVKVEDTSKSWEFQELSAAFWMVIATFLLQGKRV